MTEVEENDIEENEDDEDYPPAVTDPAELPTVKPPKDSDGNDQEAAELPPLDDELEKEEDDGEEA